MTELNTKPQSLASELLELGGDIVEGTGEITSKVGYLIGEIIFYPCAQTYKAFKGNNKTKNDQVIVLPNKNNLSNIVRVVDENPEVTGTKDLPSDSHITISALPADETAKLISEIIKELDRGLIRGKIDTFKSFQIEPLDSSIINGGESNHAGLGIHLMELTESRNSSAVVA